MLIVLRPPEAAGPLFIGAAGEEAVGILRELGQPLLLCGMRGSEPGWGVERPSGLFISLRFDAGRVDAVELCRPSNGGDVVTYDGLDVFTTPAADLVTRLRADTTVVEEEREDQRRFTAPDLLLTFWQFTTEIPDGYDRSHLHGVLVGRVRDYR
ncbi:MAG: hypothetical protein J2P15_13450 [Micromonosporaceae bacterium]|nr:hypothetical protein [Micromonosporaceae bacterium]